MSNNRICCWALIFIFFFVGQVYAQNENSIIYDLYYNLIRVPENGDQFIQNNIAVFNNNFYSCLEVVSQRTFQIATQERARCNNIANPNERAACHNNNEAAKIFTWTNEIYPCCQGTQLWSQTDIGAAAIIAKRELDNVSPGQYENIVQQNVPQLGPLFLCP
ncbi:MAG: hypothetical protein GY874_18470 [Desulfobacteraceae bacterium]|nr:hypothetical protein [Desulfobacteraceae bacterium]